MTESLSRISSIFEQAKTLTIEAAVSASSRLADTPGSLRPQEINNLLNSRVDRDVLNGMKCVIAMIARGEDGLPYFANIVKNITSPDAKVRNLVLIYLTRYAEVEPDKALLSINSIQKLLDAKSPVTRANSIKALSGIRISSLSPILLVCIKRTVTDKSPLVRSSTAIAIGKVYDIDKSHGRQLFELLGKLLADSDAQVVGTAIKAYAKMAPHFSAAKRWAPIHGHYRRFCKLINEFDEWAQAILIDILTDYTRLFIPRPKLHLGEEIIDLPDDLSTIAQYEYEASFDEDQQLFLKSIKPLILSTSETVILSIARSLVAIAPLSTIKEFNIADTLCAITANATQIRLFALEAVSYLCSIDPSIFKNHYRRFYIFPSDTSDVAEVKLELLSRIVDESNIKSIMEELRYNALHSENPAISKASLKAIGRCSEVSVEWNERILKWCLKNIRNTSGGVLNELLTVIRYLIQIQQQGKIHEATIKNSEITKIVYNLSLILHDENIELEANAKASIIWIVGEYTKESDNLIAPDVLRLLLKNFADEPEAVRYQILVLAAKLYSISLDESNDQIENNTISKMFQYALTLAKYDQSFDTRDRARMFNVLLNSGSEQFQLASLFLQVPKPAPVVTSLLSSNMHTKVLSEFFKVGAWAETDSLPSSDIRKEAPVQENKLNSGFSGITSSSIDKKITEISNTTSSFSSQQYHNTIKTTKPAYQLQSLDEFFGSDDSVEEYSSSDDSEDEEEEEEEEEEDSDDSEGSEAAEEEGGSEDEGSESGSERPGHPSEV